MNQINTPRVLVVVENGVVSISCDEGVRVAVFDKDVQDECSGLTVPVDFFDLASMHGIEVSPMYQGGEYSCWLDYSTEHGTDLGLPFDLDEEPIKMQFQLLQDDLDIVTQKALTLAKRPCSAASFAMHLTPSSNFQSPILESDGDVFEDSPLQSGKYVLNMEELNQLLEVELRVTARSLQDNGEIHCAVNFRIYDKYTGMVDLAVGSIVLSPVSAA